MVNQIDIDGGGCSSAGQPLYDAGPGIAFTMTRLMGKLAGGTSMAGSHSAGATFANSYDGAASELVTSGCGMSTALQNMGLLVETTAYNHAVADAKSHPKGTTPLPAKPTHKTTVTAPVTPPSSTGGTGEKPSWWQEVSDAMPLLEWPDADTGRLRAAADAWDEAANGFEIYRSSCTSAKDLLTTSRSPEIDKAVTTITKLDTAMGDLASNCRAVALVTRGYAGQVDSSRPTSETIMAEVFGGLVLTAVIGIGLTWCTAGASDAAAEAAAVEGATEGASEAAAEEGAELTEQQQATLDDLMRPDKSDHIFPPQHNFDALVEAYGGREAVLRAIVRALPGSDIPAQRTFEVVRSLEENQ